MGQWLLCSTWLWSFSFGWEKDWVLWNPGGYTMWPRLFEVTVWSPSWAIKTAVLPLLRCDTMGKQQGSHWPPQQSWILIYCFWTSGRRHSDTILDFEQLFCLLVVIVFLEVWLHATGFAWHRTDSRKTRLKKLILDHQVPEPACLKPRIISPDQWRSLHGDTPLCQICGWAPERTLADVIELDISRCGRSRIILFLWIWIV